MQLNGGLLKHRDVYAALQDLRSRTAYLDKQQRRPASAIPQRSISVQDAIEMKAQERLTHEPHGLSASQEMLRVSMQSKMNRVIDEFREIDTNGNGTVDKREFGEGILRVMGRDSRFVREVDHLFDAFDTDKSGGISYKEFDNALRTNMFGARQTAQVS